MDTWLIWVISGGALILLELIIPGGVTIFVGLAAMIVGLLIKFQFITTTFNALLIFLVLSIVLLLFLRTLFMKYFEGDYRVQNTNEDADAEGSIVDVTEDIFPHREGRINFRGTGWQARSDEEILKNEKAIIVKRDGNVWVVKSI